MDIQVPENLGEVEDIDQLNDLEAALNAQFDEAFEAEVPVVELEAVASALGAVRARTAEVKAAVQADSDKRTEIKDSLAPVADDAPTPDVLLDDLDPATGELIEASIDVDPADEVEIVEKELVTASASSKRPSASGIARRAPVAEVPAQPRQTVSITAAADVPGFSSGAPIEKADLVTAMHSRARGLANMSPRLGIGTIDTGIPAEFTVGQGDDPESIMERLIESRLGGNATAESLVASGGWCTPSDVLFDQFAIESRSGLIDLPTLGVAHGGVQVPSFFGISDAAAALWTWTEATDITPGGATKACLKVPCPTWTDYRLEAEGLCLTHGNLMDRSYPQQSTRFVDLTMTAHMHKVSNAILAKIVATATAVTAAGAPSDGFGDVLGSLDLEVADFRSEHLMDENVILDGMFPMWLPNALRSTLAMRAGIDPRRITLADIIGEFTARNVRPQFLAGYQPLYAAAPATAFPTTVNYLLSPTGAVVKGDGGSIDLGVQRDSTLNATNDFTLAWTEQFYQVIQRGPVAREVTASLTVNGQTGGPAIVATAT